MYYLTGPDDFEGTVREGYKSENMQDADLGSDRFSYLTEVREE